MIIRRFEFINNKNITTQKVDEINNFIWIAYAKNSDNKCIITKSAKFFPTQTYFSLERAVDNVNEMDSDGTNIYVAYDDTTLLGEIINQNTPLSVTTVILKGSIVESPVDVKINGSDLWFLLPGNASGTNSKLLKYNTSGTFIQEVDLINSFQTVVNANTMTIDGNNDIWIGTFETPAKIVRVFEISGGLFDFTVDETLIA